VYSPLKTISHLTSSEFDLKRKNIAFFGFVGVMIGLGLFVNSAFFLVGMVSLCGGHMLLGHNHGNEHTHDAVSSEEEKKHVRMPLDQQ